MPQLPASPLRLLFTLMQDKNYATPATHITESEKAQTAHNPITTFEKHLGTLQLRISGNEYYCSSNYPQLPVSPDSAFHSSERLEPSQSATIPPVFYLPGDSLHRRPSPWTASFVVSRLTEIFQSRFYSVVNLL